jgi:hypothetical protein
MKIDVKIPIAVGVVVAAIADDLRAYPQLQSYVDVAMKDGKITLGEARVIMKRAGVLHAVSVEKFTDRNLKYVKEQLTKEIPDGNDERKVRDGKATE